jgi:hypothetical protein
VDYIVSKKRNTKKNYFTQETEDAIVLYNNSTDLNEKNRIYEQHIHYPFFKLTENIIHTFKFYHTDVENLQDLQHELIIFLLSKIHLFNPELGTKAYSYFGTAVKRYLILYNEKNYKNKINNIIVNTVNNDGGVDNDEYENNTKTNEALIHYSNDNLYYDDNKDKLFVFVDEYVEYCTEHIYDIFPKKADATVADCILEIFRKRDTISVFNKKALYIYIREMIDVKTPKITEIADKLRKIFEEKYIFYQEYGYFPK